MKSGAGFIWSPTAFHDRGLVIVTSGILNTLSGASAGVDVVGLSDDIGIDRVHRRLQIGDVVQSVDRAEADHMQRVAEELTRVRLRIHDQDPRVLQPYLVRHRHFAAPAGPNFPGIAPN